MEHVVKNDGHSVLTNDTCMVEVNGHDCAVEASYGS